MHHYRINHHGYILLVILILLQIFAWVSLLELSNVTTFLKSQAKLNRNDDTLINHFYQSLPNYQWQQSPCVINKISVMSARKQPQNWWQVNTCKLTSNAYFYIEKLQALDCSIGIDNNQLMTANYYRITLALFNTGILAQLQQSTYAVADLATSNCQGIAKHHVVLGLQMMRQI